MTIRVPTSEIESEIAARLKKVGKTARLKGFRPGKVPAKVLRQRYGAQIRQEVLADVIRASFSRAVSQAQLTPAGGPAIEPLQGSDDGHFSYRAVFEVYPEITLAGVESLEIERPVVEVTDADVDNMIERLRQQRAEWRAVDREAREGDRVEVDFVGRIGGEPFEGGEGKGVKVVIGSGQVIADFDKALVGVTAGTEKSAKVKFPKDYGAAELAGKKAVFEISVKQVAEEELPEVDEAFMEAFAVTEGGVDALKRDVRRNMQRELDERLRAELKTAVLNALHDANQVAIPNTLVRDEVGGLQAEAMRRLGIKDPAEAPPAENFVALAAKRVRLSLLVQEVIAKNSIELEPARVDARIEELCSPYEKPQEAAQLYRGSRELMAQIESTVLEEQVVDFLLEHGNTTEKPVSFEEFMHMDHEH
jgi:trigger factor